MNLSGPDQSGGLIYLDMDGEWEDEKGSRAELLWFTAYLLLALSFVVLVGILVVVAALILAARWLG
jgi:hypothetical protein